jgi:hypothetical protein
VQIELAHRSIEQRLEDGQGAQDGWVTTEGVDQRLRSGRQLIHVEMSKA